MRFGCPGSGVVQNPRARRTKAALRLLAALVVFELVPEVVALYLPPQILGVIQVVVVARRGCRLFLSSVGKTGGFVRVRRGLPAATGSTPAVIRFGLSLHGVPCVEMD